MREIILNTADSLCQPINLLDANSKYTGGLRLPLNSAADVAILDQLADLSKKRRHATDGISLLLVRAKFERPGLATFSLSRASPYGHLAPIDSRTVLVDPDTVQLSVRTGMVKGSHYAFALYRPPREYPRLPTPENSRTAEVTVAFTPDSGPAVNPRRRTFQIVRPPVVLVHGTYDNPTDCWAKPFGLNSTQYAGASQVSMQDALLNDRFEVFLTDYGKNSGLSADGHSHFTDNAKVVWSNPGGISEALAHMRRECGAACNRDHTWREGYASTQADIVAHSMGGVLARVYSKGRYLLSGGLYTNPAAASSLSQLAVSSRR